MTLHQTFIGFEASGRRLWGRKLALQPVSYSLDNLIDKTEPSVAPLAGDADGYRYLSAPQAALPTILAAYPRFIKGAPRCYARNYIDMAGDYAGYLAKFSSKTRSTIQRKVRKWAEFNGGASGLRSYQTPDELDDFLALAWPLSAQTYQERLLDAGLPNGDAARAEMRVLASQNDVRAYLLFHGDQAVSYLYLPIKDNVLRYAYLGYRPDYASHSVGTVLQMLALEQLFAERRFRYFDFTEGDGAHKQLFGTHSIPTATIILLAPKLANRALLTSVSWFDQAVAKGAAMAEKSGLKAVIRRRLRG
jgi:Acetyltransferase (GNAT) domain